VIGIPAPRGGEIAQALTVGVVSPDDVDAMAAALIISGELRDWGELLELVVELAALVVTYRDEAHQWQEAAVDLMSRERRRIAPSHPSVTPAPPLSADFSRVIALLHGRD
jgi:hypothetical protein